MTVNEFRELLYEVELSIEDGGCALAFATDSDGDAIATIKGNEKEILTMLLAAMSKSQGIKDVVCAAAECFRMIKSSDVD